MANIQRKIFLCIGVMILYSIIFAVEITYAQKEFPPPPSPGIANEDCLSCHNQPDQTITLPSGEILYITIEDDEFYHSVHGEKGYACVQCHTDISGYPHPSVNAQTLREYKLNQYTICARCHEQQYTDLADGVHEKAIAGGNQEAAVCTDCHGSHYVGKPNEPRSRIPQTCEQCHSEIYFAYEDSVHGAALIGEGNPDVPSCTDCHGSHSIQGPSTTNLRLDSPLICAECHADPELMGKYGINTDVFDTYVADFHGTTSILFEQETEGQELNTPVCIDCHGVHDIRSHSDPESSVIKENLLTTCQKCHPNATENFPNAWLGHYVPDRDKYPIVYWVDLFYKVFIPAVLGLMVVLVISDAFRRFFLDRRKERTIDE